MPFFGVLWVGLFTLFGRQVSGVGLTSFISLLARQAVRTFPTVIRLVSNDGQFSSKQGFVSGERIRIAMRDRHRHAKGKDNDRCGRVQELGVLAPGANALDRTGAVLFIGRGRTWEERVSDVFGGDVYSCWCLRVSYRRSNRGYFSPFSFGEAYR